MRYVISDTHFGHANIIEYCDRPFVDVNEMNKVLVDSWRDAVTDNDTVLFLGDVSYSPALLTGGEWLDRVPGETLVVRGNHDSDLTQNSRTNVVENCTVTHGKWQFYCEHRPIDDGLSGWQIHGHVHNNNLADYPFIDPDKKTINVSCEVVNYAPLSMDELVYHLEFKERCLTLSTAREKHPTSEKFYDESSD